MYVCVSYRQSILMILLWFDVENGIIVEMLVFIVSRSG